MDTLEELLVKSWKVWSTTDRPPEDTVAHPLRWLAFDVPVLGRNMHVEWTAKQVYCGMGYGPSEWWPPGSDWNGYRRKLLATYLWRELSEDEDGDHPRYHYHGFDLLPCPFTGQAPSLTPTTRYIGAPPFLVESITVSSWIAKVVGVTNAGRIEDLWNRRAP